MIGEVEGLIDAFEECAGHLDAAGLPRPFFGTVRPHQARSFSLSSTRTANFIFFY